MKFPPKLELRGEQVESRAATLFPRHSRKMKGNNTMNTQLIPTVSGQLDNQTQALVDAHDLHKFLGVETPFSKWIQRRIEEYGFTQALDFIGVDKIVRTEAGFFGQRDKTVQGYYLSLDMAK